MTTPDKDDSSALHDSRFDAKWRSASREEPPPSLDATILAAARREVGAGPQRLAAREPSPAKRWTPLAIAATLGAITFGLLQLVSTDRLLSTDRLASTVAEKAVVSDMPPPAATAPKHAITSEVKPSNESAAPETAPPREADAPPAPAPTRRQAPAPSSRPPQSAVTQAKPATPPSASPPADAMAGRPPPPAEEPHRRPLPVPEPAPEKRESVRDDRSPSMPQPFPSSPAPPPTPQSTMPPTAPAPPPAQTAPDAAAPSAGVSTAPSADISAAPPRARPEPVRDAPVPQLPPPPRMQERAAMRASAAPKTVERLADTDATAALAKERANLSVSDWIALIRRLRAEGNTAEAAKELAAFRIAHADHQTLLPADLRDWNPPAQ